MTKQVAEIFMQTLQQAEQSSDAAPLTELFAAAAEMANLALQEPLRGRAGGRDFWPAYLHQFGQIHSGFTEVSFADGKAVLEWEAAGVLRGGKPLTYRGVTILEIRHGRVQRFRSYYDSAAFVQPQARHA